MRPEQKRTTSSPSTERVPIVLISKRENRLVSSMSELSTSITMYCLFLAFILTPFTFQMLTKWKFSHNKEHIFFSIGICSIHCNFMIHEIFLLRHFNFKSTYRRAVNQFSKQILILCIDQSYQSTNTLYNYI